MADLEQTAIEAFSSWRGNARHLILACAPGRVNLIGDHTDYNDGLALPMIMDRAVYVAARLSTTGSHHFRSWNYQEEMSFLSGEWPGVPQVHWASYVAGMIRELPPPSPVEMLIVGDIPPGAGLSSSAALEMAVGLALEELRGIPEDPMELARIGQVVEHRYLNVQCGIMDQIVSRVGRPDHALFLDCHTLEWQHIPLPNKDIRFVVMDSRVERQLAGSKYNERRAECQRALQHLCAADPSIRSLRHAEHHHALHLRDTLLRRRIRHVLHENERVKKACSAIEGLDWFGLGYILSASHASLRDDYEVSCEELDFMVACARELHGVFGARMTGGGFGGCIVSLVKEEDVQFITESVAVEYEQRYHRRPHIHVLGRGIEARVRRISSE